MGIFLRSLGWGLVGALGLPIVAFALMLAVVAMDSRCGGPGDSGGCYMGVAAAVVAAVPFGFAIGFVAGLVRALRARQALRAVIAQRGRPSPPAVAASPRPRTEAAKPPPPGIEQAALR
jgi:hypothetical protein